MNGETLSSALHHCRDTLDEAVRHAEQAYEFGPNAYAFEALMRCTSARNAIARLAATITDLSHYVDAFQSQRSA